MTNLKRRLIGGGTLMAAGVFFMHELLGWLLAKTFDWFAHYRWNALLSWPWLTIIGVFAFFSGLWIALSSFKPEAPLAPKPSPWPAILEDAKSQLSEIRYIRTQNYPDRNADLSQQRAAAASCLISIMKQDVHIPNLPMEDWRALLVFEAYSSAIIELISRDHLDEAKQVSQEIARDVEKYANERSWDEFYRN